MRYKIDQDYHIHSQLSSCSNHPQQTPARILQYAKDNGLKEICLTDHFWDETVPGANGWYAEQNYEHITQALPLPQADGIKFRFGCEIEMDRYEAVTLRRDHFDRFDFVIIPTTHLHWDFTVDEKYRSVEGRTKLFVKRLEALLSMDLPFEKIGIAHLTCPLIAPEWEQHLQVIDAVTDGQYENIFRQIKEKKCGFELNFPVFKYEGRDLERVLRPYRIAKEIGCKFYFGSDAHRPEVLDNAVNVFNRIVDLLNLEEEDKFHIK